MFTCKLPPPDSCIHPLSASPDYSSQVSLSEQYQVTSGNHEVPRCLISAHLVVCWSVFPLRVICVDYLHFCFRCFLCLCTYCLHFWPVISHSRLVGNIWFVFYCISIFLDSLRVLNTLHFWLLLMFPRLQPFPSNTAILLTCYLASNWGWGEIVHRYRLLMLAVCILPAPRAFTFMY